MQAAYPLEMQDGGPGDSDEVTQDMPLLFCFQGESVQWNYNQGMNEGTEYGWCIKDTMGDTLVLQDYQGGIWDIRRGDVQLREYPEHRLCSVPGQHLVLSSVVDGLMSAGPAAVECTTQLPIVNKTPHDIAVLERTERNGLLHTNTAAVEKLVGAKYRVFMGTKRSQLATLLATEAPTSVTVFAQCGIVVSGPVMYGDPTGIEDIDWKQPSTHVDLIVNLIGAQALCAYMKRMHCTYRGVVYVPGDFIRNKSGVIIGCMGLCAFHSPEFPYGEPPRDLH